MYAGSGCMWFQESIIRSIIASVEVEKIDRKKICYFQKSRFFFFFELGDSHNIKKNTPSKINNT